MKEFEVAYAGEEETCYYTLIDDIKKRRFVVGKSVFLINKWKIVKKKLN